VTSRIYYTDPYCSRFDAVVTHTRVHEGRPAALLDRTAFYPTSGGQPFDTGTIFQGGEAGRSGEPGGAEPDGSAIQVVDTVDLDDDVLHILSAPLTEGTTVRGEVDWIRRFDHMQQHTGQHILSAAFDRLFDDRTVGFHMGSEVSTIDLQREVSWDQIAEAERQAHRIISDNREVAIRFVTSEHAATLALRKEPAREGTLRVIEVKEFDLSACGGTHVARTGAIGALVVTAAERFRGGTRITFACGSRAIRAFQSLREAVSGSVRVLSVLPQQLPSAIERMQLEAKDLRRALKKFQEAVASQEADRLIANAQEGGATGLVIVEALDGWDAAGLKAVATQIAARRSAAVALFSTTVPPAVVVARAPDVPIDAAATLRMVTDRFGGRGGGRADLAQGGGLGGDLSDVIGFARQLLKDGLPSLVSVS
jgi:alanyl-tRNA synthetase